MADRRTEAQHAEGAGLDRRAPETVLRVLAEGQIEAARAVLDAIPSISQASARLAQTISSGGRIVYAAAGSSGLMALADGLELPGTFGIPSDRVSILLAGGAANFRELVNGAEDDVAMAVEDVAAANVGPGDAVIVLSASGTTPYAVAALGEARKRGAATIALANNPDTPLLQVADIAILLATPAEVIAGSTRMGAGTAQKIALNMLSTLMAVHLGHVHDGYMVNLQADNIKLQGRAAKIVSAISGCDTETAARLLAASGGSVKAAILMASGAGDSKTALGLLESTGQKLRPALSKIKGSKGSDHKGT